MAVLVSRVFGLVREQIFAFFFGASREYDAFLTAFRIPNLLRDLLAEGALSTAFVSCFVRELQTAGKQRAYALANLVASGLAVVLLILVGFGILGAPYLVHAMAPGFDPSKLALCTSLTRTMFPYIFMVAIAAVAMGMLNAQGHFGVSQSASTFFNITSLTVGLSCAWLFAPDYMAALWQRRGGYLPVPQQAERAMLGMAIGTLCGGLAQLLAQLPKLWRNGYRPRFVLDLRDPGFLAVLRLMGPAVVGAAAVQLNVFVNSNFASGLGDRPISWLNYAFRLMQFPIGVFGVAVTTAALPALSRALAADDQPLFGQTLTRALELVWMLTLPAAVVLVGLGEPIIRLIYQHGRFSAVDTQATARALQAYALGLPAYAAIKLVQPAFVAQGDARTPMRISLGAVGLNLICNFVLVQHLHAGHVGLSLSTSLMALVNALLLLLCLERRRPTLQRRRLLAEMGRVGAAATALGGVIFAGLPFLQARLAGHGWGQTSGRAIFELGILLPCAGGTYLLVGTILQIRSFKSLKID
jgi:putative peptidoglycan lipid II flippase